MMSASSGKTELYVNGAAVAFTPGQTLVALIESFGLPLPGVLVEHNGRALLRSEWDETPLTAGDRLEILRVAAGG